MRKWLVSWTLPAAVATGAFCTALLVSDVPVRTVGVFGLLQLVGYVVPGTLVWRAMRGRAESWLHDTVFGTILAHAITIGVYLAVRSLGHPHLVWAFPVLTVAAFGMIPPLRAWWAPAGLRPQPVWFNWGAAFSVVLLCLWFAGSTVLNPVRLSETIWQSTDHVFLLSLAGELKDHVPPTVPFVVGEHLNYHWFTFADTAAMSWQASLNLPILLFRILPLGSLVLGFLGFALLAERLSRRWSVGLVTLLLATLVGSVSLLGHADTYVVDSTLLLVNWVGSPTQGFGQVLAIGALLAMIEVLRAGSVRRGAWALVLILTLALMGAKATFLPVLGAGVLLVVIADLVRGRGVRTRAVGLGVLLASELAFAQAVLFGGSRQGLHFEPGEDFRRLGAFIQVPATEGTAALAVVVGLIVFGWLAPLTAAGFVLGAGKVAAADGNREDPGIQMVLGMVISSLGAVLVLSHPGFSEYFFLRSGLPFGYLLVAWGLVLAWERVVPATRRATLAVGAVGLGYVVLVRILTGDAVAPDAAVRRGFFALAGAVLLTAACGALVARSARRSSITRSGWKTPAGWLGVAVCLLGMGAARTVQLVEDYPVAQMTDAVGHGPHPLPIGGVLAARYVREHSRDGDYLATNAHCRLPRQLTCDVRAFWIAAYGERRVVIEGWGYTATINDRALTPAQTMTLPYWDPELLRLNDAVFDDPSPRTLEALTRRYPVRWLVVDRRFPADLAKLRALLPTHRRFGQTVVFGVPRQ